MEHSVRVLEQIPEVKEIIIPTHSALRKILKRELLSKKYRVPVRLILGGVTRAESVQNGLASASRAATHILVHDGARPFLKPEWIRNLIQKLKNSDGVVLGQAMVPTTKRIDLKSGEIIETLNRSELFAAETPQIINRKTLECSYKLLGRAALQATDDVSIVELAGGLIRAVTHNGCNMKITTKEDYEVAKRMVSGTGELRFGLGFDRHRLQAGKPFFLGGIRLKSDFGPVGHSDGDPLLHAIVDGMLGSLGLGDIGDFFPDTSKKFKGTASSFFIKKANERIQSKGFRVKQIDATVFLERPKLKENKKKIQKHLAKMFGLDDSQVGVKAKTAEGLGAEGAGEAVSAEALVVLESVIASD